MRITLTNCPNPNAEKHLVYLSQAAYTYHFFLKASSQMFEKYFEQNQYSIPDEEIEIGEQLNIDLTMLFTDFNNDVLYPILKQTGISNVKKHSLDLIKIDLSPDVDTDYLSLFFLDSIEDGKDYFLNASTFTNVDWSEECKNKLNPKTFEERNQSVFTYCRSLIQISAKHRFKLDGYE